MGGMANSFVLAFAGSIILGAAQGAVAQSPVEGFRIVAQTWHTEQQERHRGLAVAEITFENANDIPIYEPTIACDFFAPDGRLIGSRGTHVHLAFAPGKTEIKGIEFGIGTKDAVPGKCRVISVLTSPSPD